MLKSNPGFAKILGTSLKHSHADTNFNRLIMVLAVALGEETEGITLGRGEGAHR